MAGDVKRSDWNGLVSQRTANTIVAEVPLQQSPRGSSGTFLAKCSDGRRWWVKPSNTPQAGRVLVTEQIVGRAGALIAAPVCEVAVVRVPNELVGWEARPGLHLEAGLSHGSLHVGDSVEERKKALVHRDRDDNAARLAGVFAIFDWCWGGDLQCLYAEYEDRKAFSHDHGWFLPEAGPTWSVASLMARVDEPHSLQMPTDGLARAEFLRLAAALRNIDRASLASVLREIPVEWAVPDADLETVGYFLEKRAPLVADRLEVLAPQ